MRETLWRIHSSTRRSVIRVSLTVLIALAVVVILLSVLHPPVATEAKRATTSPIVLAEYQVWHGLATHRNPPYVWARIRS